MRKTVIYNIKQVCNELDYDKLAEAIVKAQEKANPSETETTEKQKASLWRSIGRILKGEKSRDGRFLSAPFLLVISFLYRAIAILGIIFLIIADTASVVAFTKLSWQGWQIAANILIAVFVVVVSFAIFLYMVIFWGAANDIEHEKDKNYVISVFSGLVSVAALIVAIIALYKGVS